MKTLFIILILSLSSFAQDPLSVMASPISAKQAKEMMPKYPVCSKIDAKIDSVKCTCVYVTVEWSEKSHTEVITGFVLKGWDIPVDNGRKHFRPDVVQLHGILLDRHLEKYFLGKVD